MLVHARLFTLYSRFFCTLVITLVRAISELYSAHIICVPPPERILTMRKHAAREAPQQIPFPPILTIHDVAVVEQL